MREGGPGDRATLSAPHTITSQGVAVDTTNTRRVLDEVAVERERQTKAHGVQDLPDGTGEFGVASCVLRVVGSRLHEGMTVGVAEAQFSCDTAGDRVTYAHIFIEEVVEALAEEDKGRLRAELLQVAAVAVQWIEKLDREGGKEEKHDQA